MILAVTAQQAEVIKFAQMDGNVTLVLRVGRRLHRPGHRRRPAARRRPTTTGVILKILVDSYGVLPPEVVETVPRPPPSSRSPPRPRPAADATTTRGRRAHRTARSGARRRSPLTIRPSQRTRRSRTNQSEMADQIRVLIVDDIPETRDHLTKLLGFESDIEVVGSAASGREAIEMAARLNPDVVLMDINMPDMDGIAATEQLSAEVPTRRS